MSKAYQTLEDLFGEYLKDPEFKKQYDLYKKDADLEYEKAMGKQ